MHRTEIIIIWNYVKLYEHNIFFLVSFQYALIALNMQ